MSKGLSPIESTIVHADLASIAKDIAEASLDTLLEQPEIIEKIPLVGSVFAIGGVVRSFQSILLTKKLAYFLESISEIDPLDRVLFLERLRNDEVFSDNVGEYYMLMLDKADSMLKPKIMGAVFRAYCEEKIDVKTMLAIHNAVNNLPEHCFAYIQEFRTINCKDRIFAKKTDGQPKPDIQLLDRELSHLYAIAGFGLVMSGFAIAGLVQANRICEIFVDEILDYTSIENKKHGSYHKR